MKKNLIFGLLLVVFNTLLSQEFSIKASQTELYEDQVFELEMVVPNIKVQSLVMPSFNGLKRIQGPYQQQFYSNYNGKVTQGVKYIWKLKAVKKGSYTITPAELRAGGKEYKTKAISIRVKSVSNQLKGVAKSKGIFLMPSVSRSNIYVGEQALLTIDLYTRIGVANLSLEKGVTLDGFWVKELETETKQSKVILNGQEWIKVTLQKFALFPQKSGKLKIKDFKLNLDKEVKVRRGWFTVSDYQPMELSAEQLIMNVKALPKPVPTGFRGAVGQFKFEATASKTEVVNNDGLDIDVKVSGTGNLQLIQLPKPEFPSDFEIYDPKTKNKYKVNTYSTKGSKSAKHLVIPRHAGKFDIPQLKFVYFDPKKKDYVTIIGQIPLINVTRGANDNNQVFDGKVRKKDVEVLENDIRYIKKDFSTSNSKDSFLSKIWFWVVLVIELVVLFALIAIRKRSMTELSDVKGFKNKNANKLANKYLKEAMNASGDKKEFFEALNKALYGYLSDKLKISISDLSRSRIEQELIPSAGDKVTSTVLTILDDCEMAKYAPIQTNPAELIDQTRELINQIESNYQS